MTQPLYFEDSLRLNFEARLVRSQPLDKGRFAAFLEGTYFYPTSGGQDHDTGRIGAARVLDVFKREGEIVHVLDRSLPPGLYPAQIDAERRWRHMQNHTAQHILSATVWRLYGWPTLASSIGGYAPSTIDVPETHLDDASWRAIEEAANRAVFENHPVQTFIVDESQIPALTLRRPPKVHGAVRIVDIEGVDRVPCGGTHAKSTGQAGMIKIIRTEHINHKLRLHFVAGYHALEIWQSWQNALLPTARTLSVPPEAVDEAVQRLQTALRDSQRQADFWQETALRQEAENLRAAARTVGALRLVTRLYRGRPAAEIRQLAALLQSADNLVALLGAYHQGKLALVTACGPQSGLNARDLLNAHLQPFGGRGGGDEHLAQGGASLPEDALDTVFAHTEDLLRP